MVTVMNATAHWEICKGNWEQKYDYCTKGKDFTGHGVKPTTKRQRGDDEKLRFYRTWKEIKKDHMTKPEDADGVTALAFETLRHGNHVVVMIGGCRNGYAHHGIVSRPHTSDTPSIANFSSPTGNSKMRDAKLQFVRYDVFLAGHRTFGCVPCSGEEGDEAMQRERAVNIASLLIQLPHASLHEYHLIKRNCECFAWMC
eukprot:gene32830-biopygen12426